MFWALASFALGLLDLLVFDMIVNLTPLAPHLRWWAEPYLVASFDRLIDWLDIDDQPLRDSFDGLIKAISCYFKPGMQNSSPQLIIFPRLKIQQEFERPKDAQKLRFLTLPPEIRFRVYEILFATEAYNPFETVNDIRSAHMATSLIPRLFLVLTSLSSHWPIVRMQYSKRATANSKLPLLIINKVIYAEATPFFYRNHTFRFKCGRSSDELVHRRPLQSSYQAPGWTTKVELTNSDHHFPYNPVANSPHRQLLSLAKSCPRLRWLEVDYHTRERAKLLPRFSKLWARLVHIEIRITSWDRMSDELMVRRLEPVAPAKDWRKIGIKELDGYYFRLNGDKAPIPGLPQHIFRLDRPSSRRSSSQDI